MSNQLERDAEEYGLHVRQGGWRLGLLVARNVEKGQGKRTDLQPPNDHKEVEKVTAEEFAELANKRLPKKHPSRISSARVLRHLEAWERAASQSVVPPAAELSPGQDLELDAEQLPSWEEFYAPQKGGEQTKTELTADAELLLRLSVVLGKVREFVSANPGSEINGNLVDLLRETLEIIEMERMMA